MIKKIFYGLSLLTLCACAELTAVMDTYTTNAPLTENEVAQGLKEALRVGTDSAAARLGQQDGYYGDALVKIQLPPQTDIIVENAGKIPGGQRLVEDVLRHINRAAEQAAGEAGPVFWEAIRQMSISDAFTLLKGEPSAATDYLKENTYDALFELYQPKIEAALDKEIAAGISPNASWESMTNKWNRIADNPLGKMAGLNAVKVDLDTYLTQEALNGLFVKIAQEEAAIRENPQARVNALLKRVFGS
ncbi:MULTISPECIES: DUF4197 domain-containing protein [unclassified Carboxylicivirga]|uniref:DUF4197 domain-containing protein n=1 Tax=Carboxylicivirga TaxID=1628153 RepID=UPI003D33F3D6